MPVAFMAALIRKESNGMKWKSKKGTRILSMVMAGVMMLGLTGTEVRAEPTNGSSTQLYVSLDGNDAAAGTLEEPLRTLEGARDAIRRMKAGEGLPAGGITVHIRGGEYPRLEQSFVLEEQDSGTPDSPVIYKAYGEEEVTFVGNMIVDGGKFKPVTEEAVIKRLGEAADKVLVYDLKTENGLESFAPIPKNGYGWTAQANALSVLVDGEVQNLSRYPNANEDGTPKFMGISSIESKGFVPRDHLANPDGTCPQCTKEAGDKGRIPCKYKEEEFINQPGGIWTVNNPELKEKYPYWSQETDIWTSGYFCWDWADDNCAIKSLKETAGGIQFTAKDPSRYGVTGGGRKFYAFNLLCEIDEPGEWYLDRETGKLYLYPGKDISGSNVELAVQTLPIVSMDKVSNVQWQNVSFAKSNGYGIVMTDCQNVEIAGCQFVDLGQRAVFMGDPNSKDVNYGNRGGSNNTVRSCDIVRMGQGGIYLGGGNRYSLTEGNNRVVNCDISDFAVTKRTYSPAVEMVGCGNFVERNRIYNAPHTAVMFSGNDMMIEGNDIFNVCYETADVGAIYSVRRWSWQGTVVKNNYIHDLVSTGGIGSAAVYVDDLGSGVTMTENLLVNIPGYTTLFGGGRDNIISNNIQINYGNGKGLQYDNRGQGWAWYHAAGPDGECYGELAALRAHPDYNKQKWDEKYPGLAAINLTDYQEETSKGDGFKYWYKDAALPANAVIEKNILVGVANPFGNVNGDVKKYGTFDGDTNISCPKGTDIGFTDMDALDFTVKKDSKITEVMGDSYFDVNRMGLYEDEFRTITPPEALDKAQLSTPKNGTADIIVSNGVKFSWLKVDRAGSYTLQVARDEEFTDVVYSASTKDTAVIVPGLEKSATYYWRVLAREASINGAASTSEVRSFTTSGNDDASFFEGFRDFTEWHILDGKGEPTLSTQQAHSGRYSYELNQGMDAIEKIFPKPHNDIVTMWIYDNMQTGNGTANVGNVSRMLDGGSSVPWIGLGINVSLKGENKNVYAVRDGGTAWNPTTVTRTQGWHKLTWDYSDKKSCKMYVDDTLVATVEDAPYFDRIQIGDFWNHSGYEGDVSHMYMDDVTVGNPTIPENVISISLPEESITLDLDQTYQMQPIVETDPDVDVELVYENQNWEVAKADEKGLITPVRAGTATVTVSYKKDSSIKAVLNVVSTGKVNKSGLQTLYDHTVSYPRAAYTEESWNHFITALIVAKEELRSDVSTVESVKAARESLETAVQGLVMRSDLPGIFDGSFENTDSLGTFGRYPSNNDGNNIKMDITTETAHSGSGAARITTPQVLAAYGQAGLMYTVPGSSIVPGTQYVISFWAKSADGKERNMRVVPTIRMSKTRSESPEAEALELAQEEGEWIKVGSEWTLVNLKTETMPEGIDRLEIIFANQNTAESAGTYYIDDISVFALEQVKAGGVTLDMTQASVSTGDALTLNAKMIPENAGNDTMFWKSSDEEVATVENGTVSTHKAGKAQISVTTLDGDFTAVCDLTVKDYVAVSGVVLDRKEIAVAPGLQFVLSARILPEDANHKNVMWNSSNTDVATVNDGVVSTVSTGDAVITVTTEEGDFKDTCSVTVTPDAQPVIPVEGVSISETEKVLKEGEEFTLTATVSPGDATSQAISWSSSGTDVATVDSGGHVKAVKAGKASITATTVDGGHTAVCELTVEPKEKPVEGISLSETDKSLLEGEWFTLTVNVSPEDAANKNVTFSSSDPQTVTVDGKGRVNAVRAGVAIITATTVDGGYSAACRVTVKPATNPVTGVLLSETARTLTEGEQLILTAYIMPDHATNKAVTFKSSDTKIATVDENGIVSAVGQGDAVITVTTVDGGYTARCAVKVLKKETPSTDGDDSSEDGSNDRKEPDADWDSIARDLHNAGIAAADAGKTSGGNSKTADKVLDFITGSSTVVPERIINDIKGRPIVVALHTGRNLSFSISGRAVPEKFKGSLNLTVNEGSSLIPHSVSSAGMNAAITSRQFEMAHKNAFGLTVDIHMNMGKANKGRYANLYYYNEKTGELEYNGYFMITGEGQAMFGLRHGGAYLVTVTWEKPAENAVYNYMVKKGDTISSIAKRNKMTIAELLYRNPQITNTNRIYPNQIIYLR